VRLFQPQLPASREQLDRLADAPVARLRSFGHVNPHDEIAPVRPGQRLEILPGFEIRLERLGNVGREIRNSGTGRVAVCRRRRGDAARREPAGRFELLPTFPIDVRPSARRFARRDFDCEAVVIQPFYEAVDPPEAERLAHDVFIGHRLDAGMLFMADESNAGARRVMSRKPPPPRSTGSHVERFHLASNPPAGAPSPAKPNTRSAKGRRQNQDPDY